jgi:hypothetical protein
MRMHTFDPVSQTEFGFSIISRGRAIEVSAVMRLSFGAVSVVSILSMAIWRLCVTSRCLLSIALLVTAGRIRRKPVGESGSRSVGGRYSVGIVTPRFPIIYISSVGGRPS